MLDNGKINKDMGRGYNALMMDVFILDIEKIIWQMEKED